MTLKDQTAYKEDMKKLREMIADIKIAQLTTLNTDGTLRSRPMGTQQVEFDGDLWFFTDKTTHKVEEIERNPQVGISYAAPDKNRYVSVSGTAELVDDRSKMEELWNPIYKIWFPDGLGDLNIILLKISVERAEYWDSPASNVVSLVGFVKALTTGSRPEGLGENAEIVLKNGSSGSSGSTTSNGATIPEPAVVSSNS